MEIGLSRPLITSSVWESSTSHSQPDFKHYPQDPFTQSFGNWDSGKSNCVAGTGNYIDIMPWTLRVTYC